jgi:hypothetical protein
VKNISLAFVFILLLVFIFACKKEEGVDSINADIKIDSLRQDTILFGVDSIPGNLHVFYSVANNDFADIHSYVFDINALNADSASFSVVEQSSNGVPGNSVFSSEVIMGIGTAGYLEVKIDNEKFE